METIQEILRALAVIGGVVFLAALMTYGVEKPTPWDK